MSKTVYLIDFENVHEAGMEGIERLDSECEIHLFYSPNVHRISLDVLLGVKAGFTVHRVNPGKQSLDMQLVSYLGYLIGTRGTDARYVIVSKDTDYTNTLSFWQQEAGATVVRQYTVLEEPAEKKAGQAEKPAEQQPEKTGEQKQPEQRRSERHDNRRHDRNHRDRRPVQQNAASIKSAEEAAPGETSAVPEADGEKILPAAEVVPVIPEQLTTAAGNAADGLPAPEKEIAVEVQPESLTEMSAESAEEPDTVPAENTGIQAPVEADDAQQPETAEPEARQEQKPEELPAKRSRTRRGGRRNRVNRERNAALNAETDPSAEVMHDVSEQPAEAAETVVKEEPVQKETMPEASVQSEQPVHPMQSTETAAETAKTVKPAFRRRSKQQADIPSMLAELGIERQKAEAVLASVEANTGVKNSKQSIYRDIIRQFGQKRGLEVYSVIKSAL